MKTMILAGGRGTRLGSLTISVNKHLLPIGHSPLISYVLLSVVGISKEVLLVTNPENISDFAKLISKASGTLDVLYAAQAEPAGIADAISQGENFCNRGPVFVMLGDNIYSATDCDSMKLTANEKSTRKGFGAHVWVSETEDPRAYGVLEVDESGKPISVEEKPENPRSNIILTGAYLFDEQVWDIIPTLEKSARGEYEITSILQAYVDRGQLTYHKLQGQWSDVGGSVEDYWRVTSTMRERACTFLSPGQGDS